MFVPILGGGGGSLWFKVKILDINNFLDNNLMETVKISAYTHITLLCSDILNVYIHKYNWPVSKFIDSVSVLWNGTYVHNNVIGSTNNKIPTCETTHAIKTNEMDSLVANGCIAFRSWTANQFISCSSSLLLFCCAAGILPVCASLIFKNATAMWIYAANNR